MSVELERVREALPSYEVEGEIGRGGFGYVLVGTHLRLGRRVAIKQLPRAFAADPLVRRRFDAEARLMAGLDHPHVVPIFDFVEEDGLCLVVMEFLAGGTLADRDVAGMLTIADACATALAAGAGLAYAHEHGVFHRDIKPENLLFTDRGVLKLVDFGLAKILGGNVSYATAAGEILGTPAYMAPEQVMGGTIGPATDVYGLATVLYELLGDRLPFSDTGNPFELMTARLDNDPMPLADIAAVPNSLADVVMYGIARDASGRYASVDSFSMALADAAAHAFGTGWLSASLYPVFPSPALLTRVNLARIVPTDGPPANASVRLNARTSPNHASPQGPMSEGAQLVPIAQLLGRSAPTADEPSPPHKERSTMEGASDPSASEPSAVEIDVEEPGSALRRLALRDGSVFGRKCEGINLRDDEVSRRHFEIRIHEGTAWLLDLGSTNGTKLNGAVIAEAATLQIGDVIAAGRSKLSLVDGTALRAPQTVVHVVASASLAPPPTTSLDAGTPGPSHPTPHMPGVSVPDIDRTTDHATTDHAAGAGASVTTRPDAADPLRAHRPELDSLMQLETPAATIRFKAGTLGERAASDVATSFRQARKRLAGFGSEPWGVIPQVCLVDPFDDPNRPGEFITEGTLVDPDRAEIWMVVTAEAPPEPADRPLAILFGSSLPAAAQLAIMIEGYGLHLSDVAGANAELAEVDLPPLDEAEGTLRSTMALSFVRYLIKESSEDELVRFLSSARPTTVDAQAAEVFGASLGALENQWQMSLWDEDESVPLGQFLRMSRTYLKPFKAKQIEIFVFSLVSLAFTVVYPLITRSLFDGTILETGDFSQVLRQIGILGFALAVSMAGSVRQAYVSAQISSSVTRELRLNMFGQLQHLSMGWYSRHFQGDVMSRLIADVMSVEAGLSSVIREGFVQTLTLLVTAGMLVYLNPLLGAMTLLLAPVVVLIYRGMGEGAQKRSMAVERQMGVIGTIAGENYDAQPVVKAFGLEARETSRFRNAANRLLTYEIRLNLFGGLFGVSVGLAVSVLRLLVMAVGFYLVINGGLSFGGFIAFITLMGEVISPMTQISELGKQVQRSSGSLIRINEVLEADLEVTDAPDAVDIPRLEREVRLDHVAFSYTPAQTTLHGVDLAIAAGTRVAIVGPSGSGKSSTLNLLMRFYDPSDGQVTFDGHDLRRATLASVRRQTGVVFQDSFLFEGTIRDNIVVAKPDATEADLDRAIEIAGLAEFVASQPRGIDSPVGERGSQLSGGQRQRVAIARAIVRDPALLLLDEATSALDPRTERQIADALAKASEGRTTVAVTHRLLSVSDYDQIVVIVDGTVVEHGTHEELLTLGGTYQSLWNEQTGEGRAAVPGDGFALTTALSHLPLFSDLSPDDLTSVARQGSTRHVEPGEMVFEGQWLAVVRSGRAEALVAGPRGASMVSTPLGVGDAFGLSAVLGSPTNACLRASTDLDLVVFDEETLHALSARYATVRSVLAGASTGPQPAGGRHLSRMSATSRAVSDAVRRADFGGGPTGRSRMYESHRSRSQ